MKNKCVYVASDKAKKSIIGLEYILNHISNKKNILVIVDKNNKQKKDKANIIKIILRKFIKYFFNNYNIKVNHNSVEELCIKRKINYLKVEDKTLYNIKSKIELYNPDYILVNGWGWKIHKDVINLSKKASLNCHSSYLPYYRGASVYFHVLMNKEKYTGITVHEMTDKIDKGNIIKQKKIYINKKDTPNSLLEKLAKESGPLLLDSIKSIELGEKGFLPKEKGFYVTKITFKKYVLNKLKNEIRIFFGLQPKKYNIKSNKRVLK